MVSCGLELWWITPGISCEAVPASEVDHRGHEAALLPRNGAAESFVSFIPLFDTADPTPAASVWLKGCAQPEPLLPLGEPQPSRGAQVRPGVTVEPGEQVVEQHSGDRLLLRTPLLQRQRQRSRG